MTNFGVMEPEYLERIRERIKELEDLVRRRREEIERAKRAGIEVGVQEAEQMEFERQLKLLREAYFEGVT